MGWREPLETLQKQFEARAAASHGLHHLMVEVADHERDRMRGPDWFTREAGLGASDPAPILRDNPWYVVQFSGLPLVHPRFRELRPEEPTDAIPQDRIVRDGSGAPRAVFEPMRLRSSYLCGDHTALKGFESLAEAASRVLTGAPELNDHEYAEDVVDLFRKPRGGVRYVFGDVPNQPPFFLAKNWDAGQLTYPHGVLIDLPIAENEPGVGHWLLLLHRLSWRRVTGTPLQGQRLAWHENTTVPFEWVVQREFDAALPDQWRNRFAQIPTTSYYSILGERNHPLDVNLASAFAVGLLLTAKPRTKAGRSVATAKVDYSKEPWQNRPIPPFVPGAGKQLRKEFKPKIVMLTATPIERDTVLRHLEPLPGTSGVVRVFQDRNTFFVARLGQYPIVLCMCTMGASGRDSAQIVTGEAIRFWNPSGLIMTGIAYGRNPERQKIGDVLVSERIIAYEPERVGVELSVPRGQQFLAGARLLDRFKNVAVDWCFRDPSGSVCTPHFGAVLSGEKLIDNPDFKARLFLAHPNAIGGEMEGVGLAAAAERERCEWILVKAICDWADGEKTDQHQAFAAASAVSFIQHLLTQSGVI
jgi:nucleoside phosphorylase